MVFVASIISSHVISESPIILSKYLPFSQVHVLRFQIYIFSHTKMFFLIFALTSTQFFIPLLIWIHFLPMNLHLHLNDIYFINVFYSFVLVIILKTLKFTSFVLFEAHVLLDVSSRLLQLSLHLSQLIIYE